MSVSVLLTAFMLPNLFVFVWGAADVLGGQNAFVGTIT